MALDQTTRDLQEGPARRVAGIARVGARYGFGFVFRNRLFPRRREAPGRVGLRLRLSLEELGPNFVELGRFLAARRDLLPPDVATELGRAAAPPKPIPFGETRPLVERELGNTLERLFVGFSETPERVGTFSQSHRAVLPGDRPALVVIARPGVRRDLLAMRPVADLTRRRLGSRLPLDPNTTVAEFAAHAATRRDMYAAAQNARRLRDLDGPPLHVPDVYKTHSSARCVTFEAPPEATFLTERQYQEVSRALVRLTIEEGIFLADVAPGRFIAAGDRIWFADPTETLALDPERLRGVAEVLAAARRGDVDAVIRALPLAGGFVPQDDAALRRELREALGALGGPLWAERPLKTFRDRGLEAVQRGDGARLPGDVAQMFGSLVAAEELGGEGFIATGAAAEAAEKTIGRFRDPQYVVARTARRLAQPDTYADYPRQIHALLNELKDGEVEVRFRHEGLDELISKVDILANRLVFAVLIAALIVGSSMLGIFTEGGARLLGVSVFGLIGFVFAAILGVAVLVGIIRSGRL